jgi:hypothetical protein
MSAPPPNTRFVSRGRLNGVLRQPSGGGPADAGNTQPGREQNGTDEPDTQTYEALYYRARLVLGDSLPRPPRFQLRGH